MEYRCTLYILFQQFTVIILMLRRPCGDVGLCVAVPHFIHFTFLRIVRLFLKGINKSTFKIVILKGQSNEIFDLHFFLLHNLNQPGTLTNGLKYFRFWLIFRVIRVFVAKKWLSGVSFPGESNKFVVLERFCKIQM